MLAQPGEDEPEGKRAPGERVARIGLSNAGKRTPPRGGELGALSVGRVRVARASYDPQGAT
ncbi:hypothetical protein HRbin15_00385 [bacterium HR15]|nr:hypothetical protein HRbin15_00385 [bacterium HR15]